MGEAIAVDGSGSPPSAQIIFSAIDEEKEGDCALPPEKGGGLQGTAAGRPGEPPAPLRKPLKTYPPLSDLRQSPPPLFAPSRAQEFPTLPPKPLKMLPKPEEDKKFFEQWRFKNRLHAQYAERAPWRKPPQGALTQAKRKAER